MLDVGTIGMRTIADLALTGLEIDDAQATRIEDGPTVLVTATAYTKHGVRVFVTAVANETGITFQHVLDPDLDDPT